MPRKVKLSSASQLRRPALRRAQIRGNGRADGVELGDRRLQPLPHLAPVADRNPDFDQDRRDRRHHFRAGAGEAGP